MTQHITETFSIPTLIKEGAAMFAPKIAKSPKGPEGPTSRLAPRLGYRLGHDPAELSLFLQRTIGNQATLRLLGRQTSRPAVSNPPRDYEQERGATENTMVRATSRGASWDFSEIPVFPLGRASQSPGSSAQAGIIQRNLVVGQANDPFEQEADRAADQVMRMPKAAFSDATRDQAPQRKVVTAGTTTGAPASVYEALHSSGQPLDADTRAYFEPRFGYDFSRVRIHTDSAAARSAREIGAAAYTVGRAVVFAAGEYSPHSATGTRLLAHELAHVVQPRDTGRIHRQLKATTATLSPRDQVRNQIEYFHIAALYYANPLVGTVMPTPSATSSSQANFEARLDDWYSETDATEHTIDSQLNGDTSLKQDLRSAYIAAIRALVSNASKGIGKSEDELYRENNGRIPMWAWPTPHRLLPSISTPIAEGRAADPLTGGVSFTTANGWSITILTDDSDSSLGESAETRINFPFEIPFTTIKGKTETVDGFTPPAARAKIQTFFGPKVSAGSASGYGRGTTAADIAGGKVTPRSTTVGFHEGNHGLDYIRFLEQNAVPAFTGTVGMTKAAFQTAIKTFKAAISAFKDKADASTLQATDCVGTTLDQYDQGKGITGKLKCPRRTP
jgi:hypothetical protein